jgi:Uma2 family endonuclease
MSLTLEDLEQMQQQHPDYRMELVKGNIIVMSPSGYESDERIVELYNFGQEAIILRDGDILTVPDLLPGWEVPIVDLWPLEFD